MNDKCLLEDILNSLKGVCDLYMHGTLESSTTGVHEVFNDALSKSLDIQHKIYKTMEAKGWYPTEAVQQDKIMQTKQQFISQQ